MNCVAIIPARGGSKRIPKKNIRLFAGRPMISYSIEQALAANVFDRIILSTDSEEIAEVGRNAGAEVPFLRPEHIADDYSPLGEVVWHTLDWLRNHGEEVTYLCCILATAPFLDARYIRDGFEKIRKGGLESAFSVTSYPYPIFRSLRVNKQGWAEMIWPEFRTARSQDLPEAYHDAGQFYWADAKAFYRERKFFMQKALPIMIPRHLVQDIDTPEDWKRAEFMYKAIQLAREQGYER